MEINIFKINARDEYIKTHTKKEQLMARFLRVFDEICSYSAAYKPKHRFFSCADFCPNCENKLNKIFVHWDSTQGSRYIYECKNCGYEYATYED